MLYLSVAVLAAAAALAYWMFRVEPRAFRVRRVRRSPEEAGLPEMKLLHLTDTHFHGRDETILSFLEELAEKEDFDLVLFTGDLIDSPQGVASLARAASFFRPRIGGYAVLGGHDYRRSKPLHVWWHLLTGKALHSTSLRNPADRVIETLESNGVEVLRDSARRLTTPGGESFGLVGLRDSYVFTPDLTAAWNGKVDGLPVIAISHSPDALDEVCERGARLALFGHTHGGQVRFPLVGAVMTRCDLPSRFARGTFARNGTTFVVNCGLGTSPATPFRLLCRPEAVIVHIRPETNEVDER